LAGVIGQNVGRPPALETLRNRPLAIVTARPVTSPRPAASLAQPGGEIVGVKAHVMAEPMVRDQSRARLGQEPRVRHPQQLARSLRIQQRPERPPLDDPPPTPEACDTRT
jgi:hypothetical protein